MGTRNLTCVFADGEYRVAQYGQWDGYPEGQGVTALEFLREANLPAFKAKCLACRWITDDEHKAQWAEAGHDGSEWVDLEVSTKHKQMFPHSSRDAGAKVLQMVAESNGLALGNNIEFAKDSLFCEWAYVVDLDAGALEVYKGWNHDPLPDGERFAGPAKETRSGDTYYPVRLVKKFALNDLPSKEEFIRACAPVEDDE